MQPKFRLQIPPETRRISQVPNAIRHLKFLHLWRPEGGIELERLLGVLGLSDKATNG